MRRTTIVDSDGFRSQKSEKKTSVHRTFSGKSEYNSRYQPSKPATNNSYSNKKNTLYVFDTPKTNESINPAIEQIKKLEKIIRALKSKQDFSKDEQIEMSIAKYSAELNILKTNNAHLFKTDTSDIKSVGNGQKTFIGNSVYDIIHVGATKISDLVVPTIDPKNYSQLSARNKSYKKYPIFKCCAFDDYELRVSNLMSIPQFVLFLMDSTTELKGTEHIIANATNDKVPIFMKKAKTVRGSNSYANTFRITILSDAESFEYNQNKYIDVVFPLICKGSKMTFYEGEGACDFDLDDHCFISDFLFVTLLQEFHNAEFSDCMAMSIIKDMFVVPLGRNSTKRMCHELKFYCTTAKKNDVLEMTNSVLSVVNNFMKSHEHLKNRFIVNMRCSCEEGEYTVSQLTELVSRQNNAMTDLCPKIKIFDSILAHNIKSTNDIMSRIDDEIKILKRLFNNGPVIYAFLHKDNQTILKKYLGNKYVAIMGNTMADNVICFINNLKNTSIKLLAHSDNNDNAVIKFVLSYHQYNNDKKQKNDSDCKDITMIAFKTNGEENENVAKAKLLLALIYKAWAICNLYMICSNKFVFDKNFDFVKLEDFEKNDRRYNIFMSDYLRIKNVKGIVASYEIGFDNIDNNNACFKLYELIAKSSTNSRIRVDEFMKKYLFNINYDDRLRPIILLKDSNDDIGRGKPTRKEII
jgi:hypothetical protein